MSEEIKENITEEAPAAAEETAVEAEAPKKEKKPVNRMKALVIGLVAVCVVIIGILGWQSFKDGDYKAIAEAKNQETVEFKGINYEKLYKTHKTDEVVLSINGSDFTWDEYFCWVYNMGEQVLSYMQQMYSYYGLETNWSDTVSEDSEETYFDVVRSSAEEYLKELVCVESVAAEVGVAIDADDEATIADTVASAAVNYCGDGATEADLEKYIADYYMTMGLFKRSIAESILQDKIFDELYGSDYSKVSDADAIKYLEDNGYMYATHILISNTDDDGNELDDAAMAEKLEKLNAAVEELRAIEGDAKRVERFKELKEELCDDAGKSAYPDGYMFTTGKFVSAFEDAYLSVGDYEVSDPVESDYGYHIVMHLPLDPDAIVEYDSSTYEPLTARYYVANQSFSELLQAKYDTLVSEYKPGFEDLHLAKYLKKVS